MRRFFSKTKSISIFILLIALTSLLTTKTTNAASIDESKIYLFYGDGCPHCAKVEEYMNENHFFDKYPVERLEVYNNRENAKLLENVFYKYKIPSKQRGVPLMLFPKTEKYYAGDSPIIDNFETQAEKHINIINNNNSNDSSSNNNDGKTDIKNGEESKNTPNKKDLTIFAVIAGSLVDSINPCAFAVLLLLLSSILSGNLNNKKKVLGAGILFSLSIFLSYLAMGLGLYKALSFGTFPSYFIKAIGILAILLGIFNLKDYVNYGGGNFVMEVPQSWRPKMKTILARVVSPAGAFLVGFIISLFLLPCTSGPYIVVLGMLSQKHLFIKALSYLIIYNLIFILPMVILTFAVYKGLDIKKAEQKRTQRVELLHLIAGILLIVMGSLVLLGIV